MTARILHINPQGHGTARTATVVTGRTDGGVHYLHPADQAAAAARTSPYVTEAWTAIGSDTTAETTARRDGARWRIAVVLTTPDAFALVIHLDTRSYARPRTVELSDRGPAYRIWLPGTIGDIPFRTLAPTIVTLARLRGQRSLIEATSSLYGNRPDYMIIGARVRHRDGDRIGEITAAEYGSRALAVRWLDTGDIGYVAPTALAKP